MAQAAKRSYGSLETFKDRLDGALSSLI